MRANIYPVPDPDLPFLGMHLTRDPHGNVLLGPTALFVGARDAYRLRRVVPRDLAESLLWPGHAADDAALLADRPRPSSATRSASARSSPSAGATCPSSAARTSSARRHSGVRAQAIARDGSLIDDFVVSETERAVHVRNAPSPAATSSLALAELIADRARRGFVSPSGG